MAATAIRTPLVRLRSGRLDDGRLAALAATGDERAFEVIYDRHHRPLLGFCRHMLGSQEEGEDALQQTFLRAHRSLVAQGPPDELRPWLFAIARNRCRTMLAARKAAAVPVEALEPTTDGLAAGVEQRADLRDLLGDIARLPDDQRSALVLAEVGDLSHAEIAAVIEVPTAKVKALVHQARTRLIADRDARETPCEDVREQLSTARGGELRRGPLRRHLALCEPCRSYKDAVAEQRSALALVLPVLPSAGLKDTILGALGGGGGGAAAAASGGAAAGGALSGGGATAGLAAKSLGAKLAIGAALAGGAGGGAVVVERVATAPERPAAGAAVVRAPASGERARTPTGAHRQSAEAVPIAGAVPIGGAELVAGAVPVAGAADRASETGERRRTAAAERREDRAQERNDRARRRKQAREQAADERRTDKQARALTRAQDELDRAVAKQQRSAARQERRAARPERGRSSPATPPAKSKSQIPRSTAAAPRRETRVRLVKPKVAAPAAPVLSPRLAPVRGKSDDAKSRVAEELAP